MKRFFGWVCLWGAPWLSWAGDVRAVVQDPQGRPVAEAVVYLESAAAAAAARPMTGVELVQKDKAFVPSVLPVTRGTSVSFPNRDTVRHHVYSLSPVKRFELKLYAGTPANPVVFDQPGVAVLGCNIHDEMVAWVVVLDTPHFAQSQADGRAELRGVPPGEYRLMVWHPNLPVGAPAQVQPQPVVVTAASSEVRVRIRGLLP
ncbi:methylamine utilization protein [Hydrogenophaga aquatica]